MVLVLSSCPMLATGCTTVVVLQHKHRTRPSFMLRHPQATCAAVLLCVMPGSREPFHRYLRKGGPVPRYPTVRAHGQYLLRTARCSGWGGVSAAPDVPHSGFILAVVQHWYSILAEHPRFNPEGTGYRTDLLLPRLRPLLYYLQLDTHHLLLRHWTVSRRANIIITFNIATSRTTSIYLFWAVRTPAPLT